MKRILGLDLGTNSIGWALIKQEAENKKGEILGLGSRIIPMSQDILGEFGRGNSISQTAERTSYRGVRRLRERHLLRRERLHRVLNILTFLPKHYADKIDFTKRLGKFINYAEPKIPYHNGEFLFAESFKEMLEEFRQKQPEFLKDKNGNDCLIPYDWTIYYLRKKALQYKISKEELAWLILNFNQKRGYYQLRGEEEEENPNKLVEFHSLKVIDVIADQEVNKKGEVWYSLHLENGWTYRRSSKISLEDWKNKIRDFIVTTDIDDDGTEKLDRYGEVKRSFRAPGADDWTLLKKKTEQDIDNSRKTVGTYIYENLLLNPKQKINGKLVRTIERKFYKEEFKQILEKQKEFHEELQNEQLLQNCIRELYRNNIQHQQMLESKDFTHLFLNDIIFYQRPLRSQKSLISNCSLEKRFSKEGVVYPIKVISKSNPYYQEFRLLQWLQNLVIYRSDNDVNVTSDFITSIADKEALLQFLNTKKEVEQKHVIEFLLKLKNGNRKLAKGEIEKYRWNYVQDKKYPMNETRYLIQSRLDKVDNVPSDFLSFENEMALWHIIYSVNDKIEYEKALAKFALKNELDEKSFVESFKKFPPFKSDYGSFSEKAIKKLLPLLRFGSALKEANIESSTIDRIDKIITGEYDEKIKNRVREKAEQFQLNSLEDFQNLPLWLAQYIVYNRHSEAEIAGKWESVSDLENYLKEFKQHSLRNPIVEQVITETLRVVKDIWHQYGNGTKNFFDEIHIELGREMKNTADERKRITNSVTENENTNLRIKALLTELKEDTDIENVRPHSPMQQEILKIYEQGVLDLFSEQELKTELLPDSTTTVFQVSSTAQPSKSELVRYKLWLEQKYQSPYTGQMIPLSRLFTPDYEIEHIIPQSLYFDDSISNKVICEAAVNKRKDNQLGFQFIKNHHGEIIELGNGKSVRILEVEAYESFVKKNYDKNRGKRNKLLLEDIPEKMIERQLNDTRYMSKFITQLLSNIVRKDDVDSKDDGVNSKHIIPGNGKITTRLKQDWGLNDVWNELILPRFERMNILTNSVGFTSTNTSGKTIPVIPLEYSKGFSKKRIDHRHHALDALVIALATRDHVNLLNNEAALPKKGITKEQQQSYRFDLRKKICFKKFNEGSTENYKWTFHKPWDTITQDTRKALEDIVVSFKQNTRVINKATNYYESYNDENGTLRLDKNGNPKKELISQKGKNWAIRKPLHKETVSGQVHIGRIKVAKGKILTATRKFLDASFNEKAIESITDTGIQKILKNYLKAKNNNAEIAFSPAGIEELNRNISIYNDGKNHQPILKVRVFEQGSKFPVGETGNKTTKYVEAAKGTNLFFGIYEDKIGKRSYDTIPLNLVIERQKQGLSPVPETNEKGHQLLFHLSPNDLLYIPSVDDNGKIDNSKIYKVVSFTSNRLYVIPYFVSTVIVNKIEYSQLNKIEITKEKEVCIKLKVDRLGNISKV